MTPRPTLPRRRHVAPLRPLLLLLAVASGGAFASVACRPDRRIGTSDGRGDACKVQEDCPYWLTCATGHCYESCAAGQTNCYYNGYNPGHCAEGACIAGEAPTSPPTSPPPSPPPPTPTPTPTTPPPTCFTAPTVSAPVSAFSNAAPPPSTPTDCTQGQVDAFRVACLGPSATPASCDAFTNDPAGNGTCISCLFEQGSRLSVTFPSLDNKSALIETSGCVALVAGKPECAVPLARRESCRLRQCFTCVTDPDNAACTAYADKNNCAPLTVPAQCEGLPPSSLCSGTTFDDLYAKVAKVLCVAGHDPDSGM